MTARQTTKQPKRWRRLAGNAGALLFGLVLSLGILLAFEGTLRYRRSLNLKPFSFLNWASGQDQIPRAQAVEFPSFVKDPFQQLRQKYGKLGHYGKVIENSQRLDPDHYRARKSTADGDLIYEIDYYYSHGRRITPNQPRTYKTSILVMGCSLTLGEGLEADQTLPAFLQRNFKNSAVHNAAWHGWGPSDALLSLRQTDPEQLPSPLKELPAAAETIGIFMLTDFHFDRIECGPPCHQAGSEWLRRKPDFQLNEKGELTYLGQMRDTHRFPRWQEAIADSATFNELWLFNLQRFSRKNQDKMARILIAIRDELGTRTGLKEFYVAYHPFGRRTNLTHLDETLRANGIKVLNPAMDFVGLTAGRDSIPLDGHPSPQVNYLLAQYLNTVLRRDNPNLR